MRRFIPVLAGVLFGVAVPVFAADKITYFACKADNDDEASVIRTRFWAAKSRVEKTSRLSVHTASDPVGAGCWLADAFRI